MSMIGEMAGRTWRRVRRIGSADQQGDGAADYGRGRRLRYVGSGARGFPRYVRGRNQGAIRAE